MKELVELRTLSSSTYEIDGKDRQTIVSVAPRNYKNDIDDTKEEWKVIDNTIIPAVDHESECNFISNLNNFDAMIWNDGQLIIKYKNKQLIVKPSELAYTNTAGDWQHICELLHGTPTVKGNVITWVDGYGKGIDFEYTINSSGASKSLNIDEYASLPAATISSIGLKLVYMLSVNWDSGCDIENSPQRITPPGKLVNKPMRPSTKFKVDNAKKLKWKDSITKDELWTIDEPFIKDFENNTTILQYDIIYDTPNGYIESVFAQVEVPFTLLDTLVYPIRLDPPITINPSLCRGYDNDSQSFKFTLPSTGSSEWIVSSAAFNCYVTGNDDRDPGNEDFYIYTNEDTSWTTSSVNSVMNALWTNGWQGLSLNIDIDDTPSVGTLYTWDALGVTGNTDCIAEYYNGSAVGSSDFTIGIYANNLTTIVETATTAFTVVKTGSEAYVEFGGPTNATYPPELVITYTIVTNPPVADFTADSTAGDIPYTVNFTDLSTNTPTSWLWDFGDTSNSTDQNPSHIYSVADTYTVSLTATNIDGNDTETKTDYIVASTVSPGITSVKAQPILTYSLDSGVTYTQVIKLRAVGFPDVTTEQYETTNTDITDGFKTYQGGWSDGGETEYVFLATEETYIQLRNLEGVNDIEWKVSWINSKDDTLLSMVDFNAYISSGPSMIAPINDVWEVKMSLKMIGDSTYSTETIT